MTGPKPAGERWDPRRESYDAFRDRKLREMIREVLAEPEFVALIAEAAAEAVPA
jgi:hypothetical protein